MMRMIWKARRREWAGRGKNTRIGARARVCACMRVCMRVGKRMNKRQHNSALLVAQIFPYICSIFERNRYSRIFIDNIYHSLIFFLHLISQWVDTLGEHSHHSRFYACALEMNDLNNNYRESISFQGKKLIFVLCVYISIFALSLFTHHAFNRQCHRHRQQHQ